MTKAHSSTRRRYRIGDRFRDRDGKVWVLKSVRLADLPYPMPGFNERTATLCADDGGELHLPLHQLVSNGLQLIK